MKINIIAIEEITENGTKWGISFGGHNPVPKDYFEMPNKDETFRLIEKIKNTKI